MAAGVLEWSVLKRDCPEVYLKRATIVNKRIRQKIQSLGTECEVVEIDGDGNCMLNAFLYHRGESKENALRERRRMIDFMNRNKRDYEDAMDTDTESISAYEKNNVYLDEIHLKALHSMLQINVVVFEYMLNSDSLSHNTYYDERWTSYIGLLYTRSCPGGGSRCPGCSRTE